MNKYEDDYDRVAFLEMYKRLFGIEYYDDIEENDGHIDEGRVVEVRKKLGF